MKENSKIFHRKVIRARLIPIYMIQEGGGFGRKPNTSDSLPAVALEVALVLFSAQ